VWRRQKKANGWLTMPNHASRRPLSPYEKAGRITANLQMGAICPHELWSTMAEVLTGRDVDDILDSLPCDKQEALRAVYLERPISFESALEHDPILRARIGNWCERDQA
jgi:hypothetical protein